jgi:arylsulfatase A-like enzyme
MKTSFAKNVILFSLDTQRADHLGCYGYRRPTSPNLDALAANGAVFTECFSPHIPTYPGHTTMFTGKDPYAHNITGQSGDNYVPPNNVRMLAELLAENGYHCGAADNLGRWFKNGFHQTEPYSWKTDVKDEWRKGEAVNASALKVLNAANASGKPFFLFFHYWDPHTPYLPPPPFSRMFYEGNEKDPENKSLDKMWNFENFKWYFHEWMPGVTDREFVIAQYDAEIAYLDACLAHIFARLKALNLMEDTLLILTADHGEEMDEHECWFDHHGLYDTNIHIPLILHLPGKISAGSRPGGFVTLYDIAPTVLDAVGLKDVAAREGMLGRSVLPMATKPSSVSRGTRDFIHITENTWMRKRGIRTHEWKYIRALEPDIHGFPEEELYHLVDDPGEKNNLAAKLPEKTAEFRKQLETYVAARLKATGLPADPFTTQPIPLRRIGKMDAAVPKDSKLFKEPEKVGPVKTMADHDDLK